MLNPAINFNFDKHLHSDSFAFTVTVADGDTTFSLPLFSDGSYNFIINWGDNSQNTITAYNQAEVTHTYSTAGTYRIQMVGTCTKFAFNGGTDCTKVRKVLNVADLGFTTLNF